MRRTAPPRFANPPPIMTPTVFIPIEQQSAAYKLFHNRYHCTTYQMNTYSKEYLSIVGTPASDDRNVDASMSKALIHLWMSPDKMADFLEQGMAFGLVTPRDSLEIYQLLNEHLSDWKRHLQQALNPSDVPMDDLRQFENLALVLYPAARDIMPTLHRPSDGFFEGQINRMRGMRKAAVTADTPTAPMLEEPTLLVDTLRKEIEGAKAPSAGLRPWLTK